MANNSKLNELMTNENGQEEIVGISNDNVSKFLYDADCESAVEDDRELRFVDIRKNAILGIGDDYGFDEYDVR